MESQSEIALLLGELRGEVREGFKGIDRRFDDMGKVIATQGSIIEGLKTEANQRVGKSSIIGAIAGVLFALLGSALTGGMFHR